MIFVVSDEDSKAREATAAEGSTSFGTASVLLTERVREERGAIERSNLAGLAAAHSDIEPAINRVATALGSVVKRRDSTHRWREFKSPGFLYMSETGLR